MENKSRGHNKKSRIKPWFKALNKDWQWIQTEQHQEVIAAERGGGNQNVNDVTGSTILTCNYGKSL